LKNHKILWLDRLIAGAKDYERTKYETTRRSADFVAKAQVDSGEENTEHEDKNYVEDRKTGNPD
jgi:hypothetical protein